MRIDFAAIWVVDDKFGAGKFYSWSHCYWFEAEGGRIRYFGDWEHRCVNDIVDFWLSLEDMAVPTDVNGEVEGREMIVEGPIDIDINGEDGWKQLLEHARPAEAHERFLFSGDRDFFYAEQRMEGRVENLWEALGYVLRYGVQDFRDYWDVGIYPPDEIMTWRVMLVEPDEALAWKEAGFSVQDAEGWFNKIPLDEALVWLSRGITQEVAIEMRRRGYSTDVLWDEDVERRLMAGDIEGAIAILEGAEA